MKKVRADRLSRFEKGHKPYYKKEKSTSDDKCHNTNNLEPSYVRLGADKYEAVTQSPSGMVSEVTGNTAEMSKLLRPIPKPQPYAELCAGPVNNERPDESTNRVYNVKKMEIMWNSCFKQHMSQSPSCNGFLHVDLKKSEKRGIGWRELLFCTKCKYISNRFTLYDEIETNKPGRRPAQPNYSLQIGLSQTPLGPDGLQKILLATNIEAPSPEGMQKAANKVLKKVEAENESDMKKIRLELKEIQKHRGEPENVIDIQGDAVYNNPLSSGVGKTPYQPATQVTYVLSENVTKKHKVISVVCKNKQCAQGSNCTYDFANCVNCPNCSKNISMTESIGQERKWCRECLLKLLKDDIEVKYFTTDSDSQAFLAASDLYEEGKTRTPPVHLLDTRHLNKNHRSFVNSSDKVLNIMPGRIKSMREQLRSRFACDIAYRCQAEFSAAYKSQAGNINAIVRVVQNSIKAAIKCYQNDHDECRRKSLVCKAGKKQNWLISSQFLPSNFKIENSVKNETVIRECLEYRLNATVLHQTRKNTNTQKSEAVNRGILRSVPKRTNWKRNQTGRTHSAIHSVNNGDGASVMLLCKAIKCPIPAGSQVAKALCKRQSKQFRLKQYKLKLQYKVNRNKRRRQLFNAHMEKHEAVEYRKNIVIEQRRLNKDHPYSKMKWKSSQK